METGPSAARPPALLVSGGARSFASRRSRRFALVGTNPSRRVSVRGGRKLSQEGWFEPEALARSDHVPGIGPSSERLSAAPKGQRGWAGSTGGRGQQEGCSLRWRREGSICRTCSTCARSGSAKVTRPVGGLGDQGAPRVSDQAVTVVPALPARRPPRPPLRRGNHERLILDRPGPQQRLPVVHAGLEPERGRHEQERSPLRRRARGTARGTGRRSRSTCRGGRTRSRTSRPGRPP
mgnify:CR=1 FL=1